MKNKIKVLSFILFMMFGNTYVLQGQAKEKAVLTEEEITYLKNIEPLKVSYVDGVAPLQYSNFQGENLGISIAIMDEIAKMIDLEVEYIHHKSLDEIFTNDSHLALSIPEHYLSDEFHLSEPYLLSEILLIYNKKYKANSLSNEKYGHIKNVSLPKGIKKENIVYYGNRKETLDAINSGEIAYTYGNSFSLAFYDLQEGYRNISYLPSGKPAREYSFAVEDKYKDLVPILNKGITQLEKNRVDTLVLESISNVERKVNMKNILLDNLFLVLIFFTLITGYIMMINRKLKAIIIDKQKKEKKIQYLSYYDSLTGLYNRRYIEEELDRLRNRRKPETSIILGDINGLKLINDNFGHRSGDKLLIKVADVLKMSCRKEDIISRYGGDEFMIVLNDTKKEDAQKIVQRIKDNCRNYEIEGTPLSISLGVASKAEADKSLEKLIKEADRKMYENKRIESEKFKKAIEKIIHQRHHDGTSFLQYEE